MHSKEANLSGNMQTLKVATPGVRNILLPPEIAGGIDKAFGSFDGFVTSFNTSAVGVFGSGKLQIHHPKTDSTPASFQGLQQHNLTNEHKYSD